LTFKIYEIKYTASGARRFTLKDRPTFTVICPGCGSRLIIDKHDGTIVDEERVRQRGVSIDEMLEKEKNKKSVLDDTFARAMDAEKNKKKYLEEKLKKSLENVKDDGRPPDRPYDFD